MKFLFIDSNEEFLNSMKELFGRFDFEEEVHCFQDGWQALNYITRHHREITGVFTDHKMSCGVSGEVIAQKCMELRVPVYVCTGADGVALHSKVRSIKKTEVLVIIQTLKELCSGELVPAI